MYIPLPKLVRAFCTAASVALVGTTVGSMIAPAVRGQPSASMSNGVVIAVFGLPFALGAALAAVPVYLLLARIGQVNARVAVLAGAGIGLLIDWLWLGETFLFGWSVLVGLAAGWAWWTVATRPSARAHVP